MTRIMRDSTNVLDIPAQGTDIVALYANGKYAADRKVAAQLFGTKPIGFIDVIGDDWQGAGILDVETGDATADQAPLWVMRRWATVHRPVSLDYPPIIYCDRSKLTPVFNFMADDGLQVGRDFKLWIATLDGTKAVKDMTGVMAVQYAGEHITGHHYDESIVYDDTWHCAPKTGILVQLPSGITDHVASTDNGRTFHRS